MILPIVAYGSPVLRKVATDIETDYTGLSQLIADMWETMYNSNGVGLAAPQIGVSLRVFVGDVDDEVGHLVNPTLDLSDEMQDGEEGCLSFPGVYYETPRALRAVARGFNMHGEPIVVEGTEFLARALQHETDHLNGILFVDRMTTDLRKDAMKEIRESEWFSLVQENGTTPTIKVSPHFTRGLGN